ncbi:uncharacterized protein LOC135392674 [Ornithodoros turicata]|uniref:uncharacterized protein LOC135392674 n=1 Tax=Ornithodoros turicata TaxID=34597 RepID=UPI0031398BD0
MRNLMRLGVLLSTKESTLQWLQQNGLVPTTRRCPYCNAVLTVEVTEDEIGEFRCHKDHGDDGAFQQSATANTWLEGTRLLARQVIALTYTFARDYNYDAAVTESSFGARRTSTETVTDWYNSCREVCGNALKIKYSNVGKIGGDGHVVEVDTCKIGTQSKGNAVEGTWVIGMLDVHTDELRLEISWDNARDAITLLSHIKNNVENGTVIVTDCWKGFVGIDQNGFERLTGNHSLNYVDPDTGANTTKIVAQWRPLRKQLARRGVKNDSMGGHLLEFLWRRDCRRHHQDPFDKILLDIRDMYPGLE